MADSLENLDMQDKELVKKVCEIFEVPYDRTVETKMKRTDLIKTVSPIKLIGTQRFEQRVFALFILI